MKSGFASPIVRTGSILTRTATDVRLPPVDGGLGGSPDDDCETLA